MKKYGAPFHSYRKGLSALSFHLRKVLISDLGQLSEFIMKYPHFVLV